MAPSGSNVTLPGPRYSNHLTVRPRGRAAPLVFTCRSILPSAAVVAVRAGGVRGFGSPSSVTVAVKVTGAETLARDPAATAIVGGLLGSSSPNGTELPPLAMIFSLISCTGSKSPYAFSARPFTVIVQTSVCFHQSEGTRTRKSLGCRRGRKYVGCPRSGPPGSTVLFGPAGIASSSL